MAAVAAPSAAQRLEKIAAQEVFDDRGRVIGHALAHALDVSLRQIAKTAHVTERALRSNPTSERLQKPGRKIAALIARLDHLLGSRRSTLIWLKSPRPQLADTAPLDVLIDGDFRSVETLVYALETGQPI
ncbi:MAG: MbcA/ParS/Xre antitoxin family protein [Candidatus Eremiobacteraeota bacterium]|nr:MbcA/ParS/Xre antitoxin family protein [Candidatus Eremiobacteraeota bacterium]